MATTKLFKNGNAQAVRIPAELAYPSCDIDLVIEREGDELRIRPAQRRMGDVPAKLARFSPDFLADGRGEEAASRRIPLVVTKHGKPGAKRVPTPAPNALFGAMAGSVLTEGDPVAPIDEPWDATR